MLNCLVENLLILKNNYIKKIIFIILISILIASIGVGVIQILKYKIELENKISDNTAKLEDISKLDIGSTLPIAGSTYTLSGSGITSSATSITLQSLTIPQNGYEIQDSDLSSTFYITLEPGSTKRQEIVSCTTVTQNANDTATLSGCTRGLSPITPFTSSSTLQFAHAGGTQVIFSDPPQLFNEYVSLANNETISGVKTFGTLPESSALATTSNQFTIKNYVDNLINQGAATSSEDVAGISELATAIESASSTPWGVNSPHVQQSEHASSTPSDARTGLWDIWSENDGYLSQLWLDLSEGFTWTGLNQFIGGMVVNNSSTTIAGNLKISGSATTTGSLNIDGELCFGGAGCIDDNYGRFYYASSSHLTTAAVSEISATTTIAAGDMGSNGVLKWRINTKNVRTAGNYYFTVRFGNSILLYRTGSTDQEGIWVEGTITNTSASSQSVEYWGFIGAPGTSTGTSSQFTITEDTSSAVGLYASTTLNNASDDYYLNIFQVELIK